MPGLRFIFTDVVAIACLSASLTIILSTVTI